MTNYSRHLRSRSVIKITIKLFILSIITCLPMTAMSGNLQEEAYSQAMKQLKKYGKTGSKYDREIAVDLFNEAADAGSSEAQYCIYLLSIGAKLPDGWSYSDIKISLEEGFENLLKAANASHLGAIRDIAYCYYEGIYNSDFRVERDLQKSYDYCQKLIPANCDQISGLMGSFYEYGDIVDKDYEKAIEWYLKAFNNGDYNLANKIANLYYETADYVNAEKMYDEYFKLAKKGKLGWGVLGLSESKLIRWLETCFAINNYDKAADILSKYSEPKVKGLNGTDLMNWNSAKEDLLYGFENMIETFYQGNGQPSKSFILHHIYAADSNPDPKTCYTRGRKIISFNLNYSTIDKEVNFLMALPWLEKGKDYKNELGGFTVWVGQEFVKDKHFNKAKEWFERAISYGEPLGYRKMAELYENPCDTAVMASPLMAFDYWKKFAETGDAYGLYTLGRHYREGIGTNPNIALAKECFEKAANLDAGNASLYSMDNLASCYISEKDWNMAFHWLNMAYSKNFFVVCHNLGDLYYYGHGTQQSYPKAFEIFNKGIESNDDAHCKYRVAYMLRNGEGVEIDYDKSNQLLKDAAVAKKAQALYLLGMILYSGNHIVQDYTAAVNHLENALQNQYLPDEVRGGIFRTLSACYRFGRGVTLDEVKADEYTTTAAKYGNADANAIEDWLNGK